jgi:8-amino-7-oxononanoate synthase
MSPSFSDFEYELQQLHSEGRKRTLVPRTSHGRILIDADQHPLIHFGSNDYLGLAHETGLTSEAAPSASMGAGASPLVSGWTTHHERLCQMLAEFELTESAVLFPSGYAGCCGTVATLARAGDVIFSDALNHASLVDGCRLSRAERIVYPHADPSFVERVLKERRHQFRRAWIVTDGVFSMDGDVAPLAVLCDLAEQYDAELIVDEAHGTGVLGARGSGACESLGVRQRVAVRIGTLSKAIGAQGGFVASKRVIIDYLINHCRPLIFSTALSPQIAIAVGERLGMLKQTSPQRQRLHERIDQFYVARAMNFDSTRTPIVPVILGDCHRVLDAAKQLREAGLYVPAIRPPTVPEGTARLRVSITAAHTPQDIMHLANQLKRFTDS